MATTTVNRGYLAFCKRFNLKLDSHLTPQLQNDVFVGKYGDFMQIRGSVSCLKFS